MAELNDVMATLIGILWHDYALLLLLGTGVVFTVWSGFGQYRALTHGTRVIRGSRQDSDQPGAISPFQALSTALSGTVGLGNIGGVALAISLGGPGAVFWMWITGILCMAIKLTEVTLAMLYRNLADPDKPRGGAMWVARKGLARMRPELAGAGRFIGSLFCVALLVAAVTGGNLFQAWNVGEITEAYFGMPRVGTGILLCVTVACVIVGGVTRIGAVAGRLVPLMIALYLLAGCYVLGANFSLIPGMLGLVVTSAFAPQEATGAFIGGTAGSALLFGMKQALFSSQAGQGSSPIAHAAAKTGEPVRQAMVAGLEPFIDTLIVCTFTALVILTTGVWNRGPEATYASAPVVVPIDMDAWSVETRVAPTREGGDWRGGEHVFLIVSAHANGQTGNRLHRLRGDVTRAGDGKMVIEWDGFQSPTRPRIVDSGIYVHYRGATLTATAFDTVADGLGKWLVTIAAWLFAVSTMISWSYYGEQGIVYLLGDGAVFAYRIVYCALIVIATLGFITTDAQLDSLTSLGTGVMLWVNLPIVWVFGRTAMRAYHDYGARLKHGNAMSGSHRDAS